MKHRTKENITNSHLIHNFTKKKKVKILQKISLNIENKCKKEILHILINFT